MENGSSPTSASLNTQRCWRMENFLWSPTWYGSTFMLYYTDLPCTHKKIIFYIREQVFSQYSKVLSCWCKFCHLLHQISMDRRPILYVLNLILPTCALYLLDMAVLFGPSSLEEKISFQITIILGSSMLAVILNNILPTSSNKPPIIGTHFIE